MKYKIVFFFFSLISASCQSLETNNQDALTTPRPNIIFILADDLGYADLSCFGQQKFDTPNIDRLAKQGMAFTQFYAGATVCAPSRSVLMTGLHTGHTPVRGNKEIQPEGQHPLPASSFTIAEQLKKVGYITGAFGKWGLGFPSSEGDPLKQGFDRFYGYNCQRLAHHYYPYHLWDNDMKVTLSENEGQQKGLYAPIKIQEEALKFIENNKDTSFFLFYPSLIPHAELVAPEKYMAKYRNQFLPENSYQGLDEGEGYRNGSYASQPESHAAFVAMITLLDEQVGEIMQQIENLGLAENTIIIFSSDNGPHKEGGADPDFFDSNGAFKGHKRDLYEGGIRVPTIVKWTNNIEPNSTSNHIAAFWDFFPTVCDLTSIETPKGLDGISFLPTLLDGGNQKEHEYLYWEFHEKGGRQAVRKGNWKAVKYDVIANPEKMIELYDLSKDSGEENNVASDFPDVVSELTRIIDTARTESKVFTFKTTR